MIKAIKWAGIGLISGMILLFVWQNGATLAQTTEVLYLSYSYGMPIGAWLGAFFVAGLLMALFWTAPRIYRYKHMLRKMEKEKENLAKDFNRRLSENPPENLPDLESSPSEPENSHPKE